jgi:selenocysteine lyase/cysteine desulfurase
MLAQQGVQLTVVQATARGGIAPDDVAQAIRRNTAMIVINHASNVTGSLQSVRALGRLARRRGVLLLVDAAQTAGCVPIDLGKDAIDLLAFSGHKALCGPQGTGGLVIGKRVDLKKFRPLKLGGTGSRSEREFQPDFLPDRFESGTPNTPGLAGLEAGVRFVLARGVATIRQRELALTQALVAGLRKIPRVTVHGSHRPEQGIAVVSFTVAQVPVSSVVQALDEDFGILCRGGLHCAPAAHRSIGTFPAGTVRLSAGYFNTRREIDRVVAAVGRIAGKRRRS